MIKYNNDLKQKLNVTSQNYMNLIIIDLNIIEELPNISSSKKSFIYFDKDVDLKDLIRSGQLDICCFNNNSKFFIDKNYLVQNDVKRIKIIINNINNLIKTFKRMFYNINIIKEITIRCRNCSPQNFKQMFHFCTKLISIKFYFKNIYPKNMFLCLGNVYH